MKNSKERTKNNKGILLLVIIIIIIILLIIAGIAVGRILSVRNITNSKTQEETNEEEIKKYVTRLEDGTILNISNKLKETKRIEGLEITKIQLTYKRGQSVILANVENKTNKNTEPMKIELILYDDKKNEIDKLNGIIPELKAGETTELNMGTQNNCVNAYDFTIKKK